MKEIWEINNILGNSSVSLAGVMCDINSALSSIMEISKAHKSNFCLFFEAAKKYYKFLKLCVSHLKKTGMSPRDSQYIRCIFGYYRSKYLHRGSYPGIRETKFDLFIQSIFFTENRGGI